MYLHLNVFYNFATKVELIFKSKVIIKYLDPPRSRYIFENFHRRKSLESMVLYCLMRELCIKNCCIDEYSKEVAHTFSCVCISAAQNLHQKALSSAPFARLSIRDTSAFTRFESGIFALWWKILCQSLSSTHAELLQSGRARLKVKQSEPKVRGQIGAKQLPLSLRSSIRRAAR